MKKIILICFVFVIITLGGCANYSNVHELCHSIVDKNGWGLRDKEQLKLFYECIDKQSIYFSGNNDERDRKKIRHTTK